MNKFQNIEVIEQELGFKLKKANKKDEIALHAHSRSFLLDKQNQIIGLNLARCEIKDINFLKNFKYLLYLNLDNNPIIDLSPLLSLSKLKELRLSTTITKDFFAVSKLNELTVLQISYCEISDFDFLLDLKKLLHLYLVSCKISDKQIPILSKLNYLIGIELSGNLITDFSFLSNFLTLYNLYLSDCSISNFGFLANLPSIFSLDLSNNHISDINFLKNAQSLESLYLNNNKISDISVLALLTRLTFLDLQNNLVSDISPLIHLIKRGIKISLDEWKDNTIILIQNSLNKDITDLIKKGNDALIRYFEKVEQEGIDFIFEAKLTFVGEGSSGKTSLKLRLQDENAILPTEDSRTRGIKIDDWDFYQSQYENHVAHIWDFGGQDVYYPVHRFFLTENSIFILLASTRTNNNNFDYWIPTIFQFGGNSPIILGQTCHDGNKILWNDIGSYLANNNFNIIKTNSLSYYELDLPNHNEGLAEIKNVIISQINKLPHFGKGVPKSWIPVRKAIFKEAKTNYCISFERFIAICEKTNASKFSSITDVEDLAYFLHSLGIIIWYSNNEELKNWIILQPEWVMNAVYQIIDDQEIQNRRGIILESDFTRLWYDKQYKGKHSILKKMLEIFKIAFPKKHQKNDYIIPVRLLSMPPELIWNENESYLRLYYYYEFMPKGLINQLSSELSRLIISDNDVWNNAVNIKSENNLSKAQIIENFYDRKIYLKANGKEARGLIMIIMNAMKNVTEEYKGVKPSIIVPCGCNICQTKKNPSIFPYEKLIEWSEFRNVVFCNESGQELIIDELLYKVGLPNIKKEKHSAEEKGESIPLKLFISYSKHDEDYKEEFRKHLVTLKNQQLISSFNCKEIDLGDHWDPAIQKEIDECDIMVCLISVDFLNTNYIMAYEVAKAIKMGKKLIPIIIKPCDWEDSPIGKFFASLRGQPISLNKEQLLKDAVKESTPVERAAHWTMVVKEFREKILK